MNPVSFQVSVIVHADPLSQLGLHNIIRVISNIFALITLKSQF